MPETRKLPVICTGEELKTYADELADMELEEQRKQEALAAYVAQEKEQLKLLRLRILYAATVINNGTHLRPVECEWVMHIPNNGIKSLIRQDSGETVTTANMTNEELQDTAQLKLFGITKDKDKKVVTECKFAGQP